MTKGTMGRTNILATIDKRLSWPMKKIIIGNMPIVAPTLGFKYFFRIYLTGLVIPAISFAAGILVTPFPLDDFLPATFNFQLLFFDIKIIPITAAKLIKKPTS